MARLYVDGIDEIERALRDMAGGVDDFVDEVLEAGGEIAKKNVKQNIIRYGYYRTDTTGQLYRSIKTIKSTDKDDRKYVDVTAAGKRENGTRNGEVAFVLNYGRSNLYGTRYWQAAEEKTKREYDKVLQEKTEAFLKDKGLD